jgi:hypothetical protein
MIFTNAVIELNDRLSNPTHYVNNPIWKKNNGPGSKAEKIFRSIYEGRCNLMANKCIKSEKIVMPRELYYEAISSFHCRYLQIVRQGHAIPKIFGMDVEIGNIFAIKSTDIFNTTVDLTNIWNKLNLKQLNGLVIVVKSRVRSEYRVKTPGESKALDTLRDMISETDFRKYLIYGFLLVTGRSGKIYQIFNIARHIQVWEKGRHVEDLCVYLKDDKIPPTDKLIAFKVMIETDEEIFRKNANVYNNRKYS